jgi:phospholipid/cholesterol/gamma-HCH transport system substrate-binding protein
MPSQKEVRWSQLKVGSVVLAALLTLVALVFLMSGSVGVFTPKILVRSYFENAADLKVGAPVNLEGVTIGNVKRIEVDPNRPATPVVVTMKLSEKYRRSLHIDSKASLITLGVLGDTVVDINSQYATGRELRNGDEIGTVETPSIPDVIKASQGTVTQLNVILTKVNSLIDSISSGKGSIGQLIGSDEMYRKLMATTDQLQTLSTNLNEGKGSMGKLMVDDSLYNRANDTVEKLSHIADDLESGKGTAGKLLKDDSVYNDLKQTLSNTNQIVTDINAGKGGLGYLAKDPQFPQKLNDTITHLDTVLDRIDKGEGTLGKLSVDDSLYKNADQLTASSHQLVESIRKDPKKYFVIRLKMF